MIFIHKHFKNRGQLGHTKMVFSLAFPKTCTYYYFGHCCSNSCCNSCV